MPVEMPRVNIPSNSKRHLHILAIGVLLFLLVSYWYVFTFSTQGSLPVNNPLLQPNGMALDGFVAQPTAQTVAAVLPTADVDLSRFSVVAEYVLPSVVSVSASTQRPNPSASVTPSLQQDPATLPPSPPPPSPPTPNIAYSDPFSGVIVESIGSGIILTMEGDILTNYHVIENARQIQVTVFNNKGNKHHDAVVVQSNPALDLALLKIEPQIPLIPAPLGNSDALRVGDPVITIGSPFGLDQTVSQGIISGKRHTIDIGGTIHKGLIQTDAAINRGNSGGPLVDTNGQVVGINTAIYSSTNAFSGVGFAVPINSAMEFLEEFVQLPTVPAPNLTPPGGAHIAARPPPPIQANAKPPHGDRGPCESCHQIIAAQQPVGFWPGGGASPGGTLVPPYGIGPGGGRALNVAWQNSQEAFGVQVVPMDQNILATSKSPYPDALLVQSVISGSRADGAGVAIGDVIFKLNGRPVTTPEQFYQTLAEINPKSDMRLSIVRNQQRQDIYVTAPAMPPQAQPVALVQQPVAPLAMGGVASQQPIRFDFMGMELTSVDAQFIQSNPQLAGKQGVYVLEVDAGSAADKSGIRPKDFIVAVNGQPIGSAVDLNQILQSAGPAGLQGSLLLQIERANRRMFATLQ
ncbi:MAG: trypsin-like peptidase domain-containing protein [Magnetococcus sp. DMHC-6]